MSGIKFSNHCLEEDGNKIVVSSPLREGTEKQVLPHESYGAPDLQPQAALENEGKITVPSSSVRDDDKPQVAFGREGKIATSPSDSRNDDGLIPSEETKLPQQDQRKARGFMTRRRTWFGLLAGIIILVLVIVLPVTLTQHIDSSSAPMPTTTSTSSTSSSGSNISFPTGTQDSPPFKASRGTGIRNLGPLISDVQYTFYQDYSGDIKRINFQQVSGVNGGMWSTPVSMNISDAANNTALYILYLTDNLASTEILEPRCLLGIWNDTSTWRLDTLGSYNFKAPTDSRVGMGALATAGKSNDTSGCKLYVGGEDGLIHEYSFDLDSREWAEGFTFNQTNGNAGNYAVPNGNITTLYVVNSNDGLEYWWMNNTKGNAWPAGNWTRGVASDAVLLKNSDVRAEENDGYVYYQAINNDVSIAYSHNTGEGQSQYWGTTSLVGQGLPGTSIEFRYSEEFGKPGGALTDYVYFQAEDGDIAMFSADSGTTVSLGNIPIG